MRRYQLRQKLWTFGDDFAICDEAGREVYYVDGRAWSIGDRLSFQDAGRNEIAFISQRLLSWGKTYDISAAGRHIAQVRKHLFTFLRCKFTVDVPGPDDLEATGSFLEMEYTFHRGGRTVATVSKRWFSITDRYGVEISDAGVDDVIILASAVVIDLCCHDEKNSHD
ncbi:MAG: hypothetical protein AMXMBFR47_09070 [Planctomycetota bacterium]